jgi:preprotein translocase SecE subunit
LEVIVVSKVIFGVLAVLGFLMLFTYRTRIMTFFVASRQEFRRVMWPTPDRAMMQTRIVLVSLVVFSVFFGLIDLSLLKVVEWVF